MVVRSLHPRSKLFLVWVPQLFVLLHARQIDQLVLFWWELKCGSDDLHEFLFSYSGQTVSRDDICSLAAGAEVSVGVIIAGSCILTCREHTKDPSTPTRVFASPFTTLNTTMLFEKICKLKLARFSEALGLILHLFL
nr:uncharacterized protein LOC109189836 [Ipomoea batatas]